MIKFYSYKLKENQIKYAQQHRFFEYINWINSLIFHYRDNSIRPNYNFLLESLRQEKAFIFNEY